MKLSEAQSRFSYLGRVIAVVNFFNYSIIVYIDREEKNHYYPLFNDEDTNLVFDSEDDAIACAIAYKHEGRNPRANLYFMKSIRPWEHRD